MYYISGTKNCYIDSKYNIVGDNISKINNNKIKVEIYKYTYVVNNDWLLDYAKANLDTSSKILYGKLNLLEFYHIPYTHIGKTYTRLICAFKIPVTIIYNRILYRVCPRFPRYAISTTGDVLDLKNMKYRKLTYTRDRYPNITLSNNDNKATALIHRLIAEAWLTNDNYYVKTVINHKDGIKHNCNASNLEWITYSGNNDHAISTRLTKQSYVLLAKNIDTGEITEHISMTKACSYIGRSRINSTYQKVIGSGRIIYSINGRFLIKYKHDNTSWDFLLLKNDSITVKKDRNVLCYNTKTKKLIRTKRSLINKTVDNSNSARIYKSLNTDGAYLAGVWACKYDNGKPFAVITNIKNLPRKVKIESTTDSRIFNSLREASTFFNIDKKTTHKYIIKNKQLNNYRLTYLNQ